MPGGGEAAPGQRRHAALHPGRCPLCPVLRTSRTVTAGVTVDTVSDRDSQTFDKTGSPIQRHKMIHEATLLFATFPDAWKWACPSGKQDRGGWIIFILLSYEGRETAEEYSHIDTAIRFLFFVFNQKTNIY